MTDDTDKTDTEEQAAETEADELPEHEPSRPEAADAGAFVPTQLGATRYVLSGFFAAGMAVAYLLSQTLNASWNKLTNNLWVSQHVSVLSRISEDERPTYTMIVGAIAGVLATIYAYRRPDIRTWADEVAAELAKVSWPSKKEVTNSTVVVIVTSAFATLFLALLDRFWGFVTNLVYGS